MGSAGARASLASVTGSASKPGSGRHAALARPTGNLGAQGWKGFSFTRRIIPSFIFCRFSEVFLAEGLAVQRQGRVSRPGMLKRTGGVRSACWPSLAGLTAAREFYWVAAGCETTDSRSLR